MKCIALFTIPSCIYQHFTYIYFTILSNSFLTHDATESNQAAVCRMLTIPNWTELPDRTYRSTFLSNSSSVRFPLTASFASPLFSSLFSRPDRLFGPFDTRIPPVGFPKTSSCRDSTKSPRLDVMICTSTRSPVIGTRCYTLNPPCAPSQPVSLSVLPAWF